MSDTPSSSPNLDDVLRREAEFRARALRDFRQLELENRTRQEEIDRLNHLVGAKDTYIHQLHLERDALRREVTEARRDVEFFVHQLGPSEESLQRALDRLRSIETSFIWGLLRFFVSAERAVNPLPRRKVTLLSGGSDEYHLEPSPYRVHRTDVFAFSGWARAVRSTPLTAVRVRIGETSFAPETAPALATAPQAAVTFSFRVTLPAGRFVFQLEGQDESGHWRSLLNTPMWREVLKVV